MNLDNEYHVLGDLMDRISDPDLIRSWEISPDYVGGQVTPDLGISQTRRLLDRLTFVLDRMSDVEEQHRPSHIMMSTTGHYGPVEVKIWALVRPPVPSPEVTP